MMMLRPSIVCLVRSKRGVQRPWSPMSFATQLARTPGLISAAEMRDIAYRMLPPQDTVEYEEDNGINLLVQREYLPPIAEQTLTTDFHAVGRSKVELASLKSRIAKQRNGELQAHPLTKDHGSNDVERKVSTSIDSPIGDGAATVFLFNDHRLKYCRRFDDFFQSRKHPGMSQQGWLPMVGPHHVSERYPNHGRELYFSVMEAAATLFGCSSQEAKEVYYAQFCALDAASLALEAEEMMQSELRLRRAFATSGPSGEERVGQKGAHADSVVHRSPSPSRITSSQVGASPKTPAGVVPPSDYADVLLSLRAYCKGASPTFTPGPSEYDGCRRGASSLEGIGRAKRHEERLRWRALLEKLVAEDYHLLTDVDLCVDLPVLNGQLGTVFLAEGKLGEINKELLKVHLSEHDARGSIMAPESQAPRSPGNPVARQMQPSD